MTFCAGLEEKLAESSVRTVRKTKNRSDMTQQHVRA